MTNATTASDTKFDKAALNAVIDLCCQLASDATQKPQPIGFVLNPRAHAMLDRDARTATPLPLPCPSAFCGIPLCIDAQQSEDCLAFYDHTLLRLYLRRNDSPASLRAYLTELARQIAARMPQSDLHPLIPIPDNRP